MARASAWLRRSVSATSASCTAVIHGSSFSSSVPGRKPELGLAHRHDGPVDGDLVVQAATPSPARGRRPGRGSSCRCRPCRRARPPAPRGRAAGRGRTAAPSTGAAGPTAPGRAASARARRRRWRTSADWLPAAARRTVASSSSRTSVDVPSGRARRSRCRTGCCRAGRRLAADDLDGGPARPAARSSVRPRRRWCSMASSPSWAALMRRAASLDTTTVRPWTACPSEAARMRLSFLVGSRPCSRISLRCSPFVSMRSVPPSGSGTGVADVAAVGDPQLLDRPDHRPGGPTDVVHPSLVLIELLHDDQRDHRVGVGERRDASPDRR